MVLHYRLTNYIVEMLKVLCEISWEYTLISCWIRQWTFTFHEPTKTTDWLLDRLIDLLADHREIVFTWKTTTVLVWGRPVKFIGSQSCCLMQQSDKLRWSRPRNAAVGPAVAPNTSWCHSLLNWPASSHYTVASCIQPPPPALAGGGPTPDAFAERELETRNGLQEINRIRQRDAFNCRSLVAFFNCSSSGVTKDVQRVRCNNEMQCVYLISPVKWSPSVYDNVFPQLLSYYWQIIFWEYSVCGLPKMTSFNVRHFYESRQQMLANTPFATA